MEHVLELFRAMGQMLRSRYMRELEREVARLRAENRGLLNSLLGTAGVPPLRVEDCSVAALGIRPEPAAAARGSAARSSTPGPVPPNAARSGATPPLRRRSWQQIGRMLEIEEARREREHSAQMEQIREKLASDSAAQQKGSGKPNGSE
jgi:hypothetical protein